MKVTHTPPAGCALTRESKRKPTAEATVTYHKHAAHVIQAKCAECHRSGEAAPFTLTNYKQAKGWAAMIREVVADDVMPPWHADAPRGHFSNDRRLTPEEKQTLLAWIDQGCAEGEAIDGPKPKEYLTGWRLPRQPDMILKIKKVNKIPANSLFGIGVPYQYVDVGEPFEQDVWVEAAEVRPDYRGVVHHIICFIIPPGKDLETLLDNDDFGRHMLGAYVPGDAPIIMPDGYARKIPKGSRLIFELHYTPNGKAGTDQSSIGLCFRKTPPKHVIESKSIMTGDFTIPPGASNHKVVAKHKFDEAIVVRAFTPHMHVRGKAFRFELITPDGKRDVLLNVPKYDFNWQANYELTKPRTLPAGSTIECTAWYDNSRGNPTNPDADKAVGWGNQTWEEMMIGFVTYHLAK